ncbi:MAG: long-chain fatty acid--CoA ligase [Oligoflexia bacterium]|nr:long-chain fatty acid--CoA ligase [Oligoflexia bacterium]
MSAAPSPATSAATSPATSPAQTSDWLAAWARFSPQADAILDVGTRQAWTYQDLHADSLDWAATLASQGVLAGDRVAVLALNRGETLALLFACAHLGAILFPLNWRLAPAELTWQIQHTAPRVLIFDAVHADRARDLAQGISPDPISPDPISPDPISLDAGPRRDLPIPPRSAVGNTLDDPWQILMTSGSSGRPKGALLTHRQIHWNAVNTVLACDLRPGDSTLTFAPLFHTGGLNCLSTPLIHRGGRVVIVPRLDPAETLALIEREHISHLMGVPTIYQLLADHPDFDRTDLTGIRDAICGGAPLGLSLLERYLDRGVPLRQGFGLTEVGPNCFSTPPAQVRQRLGTVGLPIHHIQAKVVRSDGSPCAPGEAGELLLRGPVVCGGYWRDPDATKAAIVDGWFHTGDLLSVDADGYFTVRGRLKEIYISGGENVYPAEVEATIQAHPGVALAAVVGMPDARWGEVGRAFVQPVAGTKLDGAALLDWLGPRLARYKLPKLVEVGPLPLTGSGKVDKSALGQRPLPSPLPSPIPSQSC